MKNEVIDLTDLRNIFDFADTKANAPCLLDVQVPADQGGLSCHFSKPPWLSGHFPRICRFALNLALKLSPVVRMYAQQNPWPFVHKFIPQAPPPSPTHWFTSVIACQETPSARRWTDVSLSAITNKWIRARGGSKSPALLSTERTHLFVIDFICMQSKFSVSSCWQKHEYCPNLKGGGGAWALKLQFLSRDCNVQNISAGLFTSVNSRVKH